MTIFKNRAGTVFENGNRMVFQHLSFACHILGMHPFCIFGGLMMQNGPVHMWQQPVKGPHVVIS